MTQSTQSPAPPHSIVWQDSRWRSRTRRKLLDWYDREARDLPWRREVSPYRTWISEIMLQQTQVVTVVPYFERFLESFPSVKALADADEQQILSHWEGLGYYRRARLMHAAARRIVDQHHGTFPQSYDDVIALPGIGRYTAGAILSIALDQRLPILEGNTQRLFSRLVALRSPATHPSSVRLLWQIAESMLPSRGSAGSFNQAAMELGALVCVPRAPLCPQCPIARCCAARQSGLQEEIPGKVSKVEYENRSEFALVIAQEKAKSSHRRYLVRPLPAGARWAGMWDFPRTTERSLPSVEEAARELAQQIGHSVIAGRRLMTVKHAVTKYRISLHVHAAELSGAVHRPSGSWQYVSLAEMSELPMSVTARKIFKMLVKS